MPSSFYALGDPAVFTTTDSGDETTTPLAPATGKTSFYRNGEQYAALSLDTFTLTASVPGAALLPGEWLFGFDVDLPLTFPANMAGSAANARTAAAATAVLSMLKNGVKFGTITFTGSTGTFTSTETAFAVGDVLDVYAPASADLTLAHITLSLLLKKN